MDYSLYRIADLPAGDLSLLDEQERATAARRGAHYTAVRCLLKRELACRSGCTAAEIRLSYNEHGKPLWAPQPFNLSHAQGLLALAFHHGPIGVDIEAVRPRPIEALALRIMGEEQLAAFRARGCELQEFFCCWCATEALVKWAGDTVFHAKNYPYRYEQGHIIPLFEDAPTVELIEPAPGFCGALAYRP